MKTDTVESGRNVLNFQRNLLSAVEHFTMNVGYNQTPPTCLYFVPDYTASFPEYRNIYSNNNLRFHASNMQIKYHTHK